MPGPVCDSDSFIRFDDCFNNVQNAAPPDGNCKAVIRMRDKR